MYFHCYIFTGMFRLVNWPELYLGYWSILLEWLHAKFYAHFETKQK